MRVFFSFSLLVLLLSAWSCVKTTSTGITIDAVFTRFIPPDTKVLAGIRVDGLKSSAFYKRHEKQLDIPLLDAFSERVGLDPRRDLSDFLIAWNGKQPLIMARGRFRETELEQRLGGLGAQRTAYKEYTILGTETESLVFVKKDVAMAASPALLRSAIDVRDSGKGSVPDEFRPRLQALPKKDQIWVASREGLPFADIPMRSDIGSALSNIAAFVTGASAGIDVDTGAHLRMEITCISDQGAQRVRDALRGGIGLARLTTKDDETDLLRLYDSIQVNQDQQVIRVEADVPAGLSDKLVARLSSLRLKT